jgi:hypothetical protein
MPVVRNEAPWGFPIEIESDKRIEILIDKFDFSRVPDNTIRIVVMDEPICCIYDDVRDHPECYTYVFTFLQDVLNINPKAVFFRGIYAWVTYDKPYEKKFAVSTVVGAKNNLVFEGYTKRHELWRRREEIAIPKDFYLSHTYRPTGVDISHELILGDERYSKNDMFDCMFHVCIENTSIPNYFSEKILDCFLTRTIPVYIGCPNIDRYFNANGICIADTVDEVIKWCNQSTPNSYFAYTIAIEENFQRALQYVNWENLLKETILKLL